MSILPKVNEFDCYEIRMESVGGLGANLAGKLLSEAGIIHMNLNGSAFSAYGSEKKGTPIKSFVRFTESEELKSNSPVEEPHLLVIFHENLIGKVPVTRGVHGDAVVVVNTRKKPAEIRDMLKLHGGTIYCVDAINIAREEKVRVNTTILGTICKASGFITLESVEKAIRKVFEKRYPHLLDANVKAMRRGYEEVQSAEFKPDGKYEFREFERILPLLGYENAPIGGTIVNPANTVLNDLSAGREGYIPVWHADKCTNCGECDIVCPDFCMVFKYGKDKKGKEGMVNTGIDYQYCKGCLKCVEMCKFEALTKEIESDYDVEAMTIKKLEAEGVA